MLSFIKKLFGAKPAETTAEAPYKVETQPEITPAPVVEVAVEGVGAVAVPAEAPAKKAKAKATGATKPAAEKKPRKPRTPKAK